MFLEEIMNNEILEKNREAWNEALGYHQKAGNNSLQMEKQGIGKSFH